MTGQSNQTEDLFSSEGMPTIPLRPKQSATDINRSFIAIIVVMVTMLSIGQDKLGEFLLAAVYPQYVILLSLSILGLVFSIVRSWYWVCVVSLATIGLIVTLPWFVSHGSTLIGVSTGVAYLVLYIIARLWFERTELWPLVIAAVATGFAILMLLTQYGLLPVVAVIPIIIVVIVAVFGYRLRGQSII